MSEHTLRPAVDQKCVDLAEHFLSDVKNASKSDITSLAYEIQQVCEAFCTCVQENDEP